MTQQGWPTPNGPHGHPGYGAGTPSPYGGYPYPPGPPPKKPKRWVPFVVIGAILLFVGVPTVVIVGGRLYFAAQSDEAKAPPPADVQWTAPAASELATMGSWASDGALVTMDRDHLTAFSAADGTVEWQLMPPAREGEPGIGAFCGMSTTTENGLGAIAYGLRDHPYDNRSTVCAGIMVVDLETGRPVQRVDLPLLHERFPDDNIHLDLAGEQVVFSQHEMVAAINIADGRETWRHTDVADHGCEVYDFEASAKAVVFPDFCGFQDEESSIVVLDPRTGAVKNITPLPGVENRPEIVSADPPVVLIPPEEWNAGSHEILVLDESGRKTTTIPATMPEGDLQVFPVNEAGVGEGVGDLHGRYKMVVTDELLVAATVPRSVNEYRDTNQIVAFDLRTGEQRWNVSLGLKITGVPFAATDDGVLVINDRTYENPSRVVKLSYEDGSGTPVTGEFPGEQFPRLSTAELHWNNGTVYGANVGELHGMPDVFAVR